ncbi:MAG TPA: iron transporter [Chloroflexota bacterium]|nr:iron transporter [Chloroflexota bacterium]
MHWSQRSVLVLAVATALAGVGFLTAFAHPAAHVSVPSEARTAHSVLAQEFVVGAPVERNGMAIAANYLLGIQLDLDSLMPMPMDTTDAIHLEADVHATAGNQNGFAAGDWIPYLGISYHVAKLGSDWTTTGALLPMVAKDGPHYADNTRLNGPGQYRVTYHFDPPITHGFFRHVDAATGVAPWWEPFEVSWTFTYPSTPAD